MIIMVGSMAEGRQAWPWSSNCELTSDLQVGGVGEKRREEERQEGRRQYKKALDPGMSFQNRSGPHALTRTRLLILTNGTKQTNILAYVGPFSFKPPDPSKCAKSAYNSVLGRTYR